MTRLMTVCAAFAVAAAVAAPVLEADVKTREKTTFSIEGMVGGFVRMFGGKAAREGVTSDVALKGDRKATLSDIAGRIVDLGEQKVYELDLKKKEYRVTTFAELRAQFEKAKADAAKQAKEAKPEEKEQLEEAGRQLEFDYDVKETGQHKTLAGHDTHEAVMTVTAHEKGKTIDQSGGFVMTNTMWLGPKIAALDELYQFELKFVRAVYGESFAADMQQMASVMALYPSFKNMASKMETEGKKLQGTPLSTTMTFETVRSEEQMKEAASQQPSSSGGASGMLARRIMGNRGQPQQRSKLLTSTSEMLSVATTVSEADVAIPAGYKEKK
ncbi:MAG: hypothetical protein ABI051_09090 [Vicinamibacterales bacterium]